MQFIVNTISVVDLDLIFECVLRCLHIIKVYLVTFVLSSSCFYSTHPRTLFYVDLSVFRCLHVDPTFLEVPVNYLGST